MIVLSLGDIGGFQKLLQDNPSLLKERNAFMLETPLHVSASNNKTEIVKFLLEWKGDDKVDLEAKNMYGETPLHVAAKNGCNEAARLLLAHGALVEAKSKDSSIVETLLEKNADCDATDDEGMTPLDHLSKIQESGKLRDLLVSQQEDQRKKKFLEACSKQKERMDALEKELSNIVGTARRLPHMAFLGNPGTGKTMVARILGRLLHSVGILQTDNVKEVQRTDLVGQYIGHTGNQTRKKIKEAEGGILFVDEAYRLIPEERSGRDFGLEALEEIMSCMDNGKVLVIFAGYNEDNGTCNIF
ncbi:hypothetical protein Pint_26742 [Pistacia integerrima]|uniref:Uncharacterized protein n=1 Tax=Pistacia integerrima TaxID=434235 RepID=A0ACC0YRK1_9ROSI|nr:hypothetical protein Pint_26742 [Pistacia integerrima]